MKDKELNSFLASVRRTRFVDYLDPLGETAQNAFERRLSWARVSQHDPAYADEARFLLDHAEALREVLRRELEEDDWVEEADVGREWDTRAQPRASRLKENDRITELFQPDDLDQGAATHKAQSRPGKGQPAGGKPPPPQRERGGRTAVSETDETRMMTERERARRIESAPRGKTFGGDAPSAGPARPTDVKRTPPPVRPGARTTPPPVQRQPTSRPPESDARDTAPMARNASITRNSEAGPRTGEYDRASLRDTRNSESSGGHRTPDARAKSPGSRSGIGQGRDTGDPVTSSRSPRSLPPGQVGNRTAPGAPKRLDPGASRIDGRDSARTPVGSSTRAVPPSPGGRRGRGETAERAEFAGRTGGDRGRAERNAALRAMAEDEETSHMPGAEVELEEWDAPDEPSTGIMRLEDVTAPPMKPVISSDDTVALPSAQILLDEGATRPTLPTRMRRPTTPLGGETQIRRPGMNSTGSTPSLASLKPSQPPRSRRWLWVVGGLVLMVVVGGGLVGAGVVAVPVAMSTEWFGDLLAELQAPEPAPAPKAAPQPAPEAPKPTAPQPTATGAPPAPSAPEPSKATPVAPTPVPVAPAPPPPPAPGKAKASKAAPEPDPAAPSSIPPVDVRGLWVGSTQTGMSFKLTVLGQDDANFEGTVELQLEDGTFEALAVTGKVDGTGAMSFKGSGSTFNATVNGRRASGSYALKNGTKTNWTAVH